MMALPTCWRNTPGRVEKLFISSSKPHDYIHLILEHSDLAQYFPGVCGSELDRTRTDKRNLLKHLFAEEEINRAETLLIGDRVHDVEAFRSAGVLILWVDWGYGSEEERHNSAPDHTCNSVRDLRTLLNTF